MHTHVGLEAAEDLDILAEDVGDALSVLWLGQPS
jgi:hypothetical protein